MAYYEVKEHAGRAQQVQKILQAKGLDFALIYYDEFNLGNGWYLTGWCPQFESGTVLVPAKGEPMILGGPESEPFAKQDCAIKETRNLPVFMVPDEEYPNATIITFKELFAELSETGIKKVGIVGADQMPLAVYNGIIAEFQGVEFVDITEDFLKLRYVKSDWEREQMRVAFEMADKGYLAMAEMVKPGNYEYQVAAAGEAVARMMGSNGFAYKTIVGSGARSNAVVPTAMDKVMEAGELVMLGMAPRYKGYSGVFGHTLPVSGEYTPEQAECMKHMKEAMLLTREMLVPGKCGMEIHEPARKYFEKHDLLKYLVCPFAHTIGIMEAEAPFFGPNSKDIIVPGMTICVDVSIFGHPVCNGIRIETSYEITENGPKAFSPMMEKVLLG
ncbi:MAG: aminopeptidase P family protein [Oscillospiraceae bacterium]|nr:aminopeptidase P family protein [Oscillospiraceae bacterium]MBQ8732171.1 aminopeptidase P family protein [Oscillospiraceae bacterium]